MHASVSSAFADAFVWINYSFIAYLSLASRHHKLFYYFIFSFGLCHRKIFRSIHNVVTELEYSMWSTPISRQNESQSFTNQLHDIVMVNALVDIILLNLFPQYLSKYYLLHVVAILWAQNVSKLVAIWTAIKWNNAQL